MGRYKLYRTRHDPYQVSLVVIDLIEINPSLINTYRLVLALSQSISSLLRLIYPYQTYGTLSDRYQLLSVLINLIRLDRTLLSP